MADIRIAQLPLATGPTAPAPADFVALDGTSTRKAPLSALGDVVRPFATQPQAEAGVSANTSMSPLTTKQSIASEVGVTIQAYNENLDILSAATIGAAGTSILSYSLADDVRNFLATAPYVLTRTALKTLNTAKDTVAILKEAGREGMFQWKEGDFSTQISTDTAEGIYVKANVVAATDGAWVRIHDRRIVPEWFGVPMDGTTDAFASLQCMFNLAIGKEVVMPSGITFNTGTGVLSIKQSTCVFWGGCTLRRPTLTNNYQLDIDGQYVTFIQPVYLSTAGERGFRVRESNFSFKDGIYVKADTPGTGAGNLLKDAFRLDANGGGIFPNNVVGIAYIENFEMGFCAKGGSNLDITTYTKTYRTANWIRDVDTIYLRGKASGSSPNNKGNPGENPWLFESSEHFKCRNVHVEGFEGLDAGEHNGRFGGQRVIQNAWVRDSYSKNSGSGDGTGIEPDDHGGCGFKCLGPTELQTSYHQNINFINCVVEDIKISTDAETLSNPQNFAGFNVGKTIGYSIVNPIVRRSDPSNASAYSCLNGIEVYGCMYGRITNPQIDRPYVDGIFIFENANGGGTFWGDFNTYNVIIGGSVFQPGKAGVHVKPINLTFRRNLIQGGLSVENGERSLHYEVAGTGSQIGSSADMYCMNPTVATTTGTATWLLTLKGNEVTIGNTIDAVNGSTFQSLTAGTLRIRKGGAWVSL